MKLGEQHTLILCTYSAFAEVVGQALGGNEKEETVDITAGASSPEQAIATINAALNFG